MTRGDRLVVLAAAGTVLFAAAPARAQSAEAEVLFRDGRALIKSGKLAEGCAKLDASQRSEPSVGTLLNLGDCREKLGKPASAWAAFRKAEETARHANHDEKRCDEAKRRADAIEPFVPTLALEVIGAPDGLVIRRDGDVVDPQLYGAAVPIDPGTYTITADAPERVPWRSVIVVTYKTQRTVTIPALARDPHVPKPEMSTVAPPPSPAPRVVSGERSVWSPWRKVSVGLGAAGVGAIGTGVLFAFRASAQARDEARRCEQMAPCTDPVAIRDHTRAGDSAAASRVLYLAGGATIVTSLLVWFAGAPAETTVIAPAIAPGQAGAAVTGTF